MLHIGDIILFGGKLVVVDIAILLDTDDGIVDWEDAPLTEENLLATGFTSNPYQDRYEKDGVYVECDKTRGSTELWVEGENINTMRKLQTLYTYRTGKTLTI